MQIEIPDTLYQALAQRHGDVAAFVQQTLRSTVIADRATPSPRFDATSLLQQFEELQSMFAGESLEKVLASRRNGLE